MKLCAVDYVAQPSFVTQPGRVSAAYSVQIGGQTHLAFDAEPSRELSKMVRCNPRLTV